MDANPLCRLARAAAAEFYAGSTAARIIIQASNGKRIAFDVPDKPVDEALVTAIRCSVDCFAEVLATIVQTGHRLTRAAPRRNATSRHREQPAGYEPERLWPAGLGMNRRELNP